MHKEPSWRARAMYIVFAFALVFGLAGVVAMPQTAPVKAAITGIECGSLNVGMYASIGTTDGTAEWSTAQKHTGTYSAALDTGVTDSLGWATATVPYGGTLTAFSALDETAMVFWIRYTAAGKNPYGVLYLDTDADGVADLWLLNKGPSAGSIPLAIDTWCDAHLSTAQAPDTWHVYAYDAATGEIDGSGVTNLAGDPDSNDWKSLVNWAATGYSPADGTFGDATVTCVGQMYGGVGGSQGNVVYVDEMIIGGVTYGMEPCYSLEPSLGLNVKTAEATFTVRDAQGVPIDASLVGNWFVLKGEGEGEVVIIAGGNTNIPDNAPHNYITVRMGTTGDCHITCDVDYDGDETADITLDAEKKWGELHHTVLDVDDSTTAVEHEETVTREADVVTVETLKDTVYAQFIQLADLQTAGGALVHWWLFKDTTANQDAIDDLMDELAADNGFLYDNYWSATGEYDPTDPPIDVINALVATQHATDTTWTALPLGGTIISPWYATTITPDDQPGEIRGITKATLTNDGDDEDVMIVVLVDYPMDKNGENRICLEKGKKSFTTVIVPPPYLEKIPQVAWAGEKVTLEQSWGTDYNNKLVGFHLEHPGLGTLEAINESDCQVSGDLVYTKVIAGVARCLLDSEDPGQADIKVVLREDEVTGETDDKVCDEVADGLLGITAQTGLVVYYLKLESITPLDPDPAAVMVGTDVDFGVEVKGWFTSSDLSTRPARLVDLDGDGVDDHTLPAYRWILPDDWAVLAGADWETLRPHWDIMDSPDEDITSQATHDEWGPYDDDVNTPDPPIGPGEAEYPVIGPFSLLQPFAATQWLATASVWADYTVAALITGARTAADVRTTVVPDGELNAWDAPMPPAEIIFNATDDLSEADKGSIYVTTGGAYTAPFYGSEIPATLFIPPMIAGNGYEWDSWGTDGAPTTDEGPYDFWTDLNVSPTDDEALEVYSDNHGIAYVTIDTLSSDGTVTISATAEYPYLTGKHGAMKSDDVTQTWGEEVECNPDFEGTPRECADAEVCDVTFENLTDGCATPYKEMRWDFDGNGVIETTKLPPNVMDPVSWDYSQAGWGEGVYTVCLSVLDDDDVVTTQCQGGYITVGTGAVETITWTFVEEGFFGRTLPSAYSGDVVLDTLTDIPAQVSGVWYDDFGFQVDWPWWLAITGSDGLTSLTGNRMYMVLVSGACTWEIELTP